MGSEDTAKLAARQRGPTTQMALVAVFAAVALIWWTLSSPHLVTEREAITALSEASQMEVERYCNRELANVVAIQEELRSLGEHFDNIKEALAPSALQDTFQIDVNDAAGAILPGHHHHRRHRRHLHSLHSHHHHHQRRSLHSRIQTTASNPSNNRFVHPLDRTATAAPTCPSKLASALATISSWLGALHTEVLALKRGAAKTGAATSTQGRTTAEGDADASSSQTLEAVGDADRDWLKSEDAALGAGNHSAEQRTLQPKQLEIAQQLEAALAAKDAAEKALAAAKEHLAMAQQNWKAAQQKLAAATAPAVPGQPPNGQCWVPHKSDGVRVNRAVVQGSPVYIDHVRQAMVLPVNDEWVSKWIVSVEAPFDTPILRKMLSYIREGDVVLDIGANLGTYSIWFANKVGAAGAVWAFEPQPYVYQVLCTNVVINGHRNIRTVNAALSFRSGFATMDSRVPDGTSAGKNFTDVTTNHTTKVNYGGRRLGSGGEKVPMQQLDELQLPKVSFMKIDVQGAEPLVLWGARETIRRTLPVVNFEVSGGYPVTPEMKKELHIPDEVANFDMPAWLKSIGYRFVEKLIEDQFWVPPGWVAPPGWNATEASSTASSSSKAATPGQPLPPATEAKLEDVQDEVAYDAAAHAADDALGM